MIPMMNVEIESGGDPIESRIDLIMNVIVIMNWIGIVVVVM
jgi:hypothetical protein